MTRICERWGFNWITEDDMSADNDQDRRCEEFVDACAEATAEEEVCGRLDLSGLPAWMAEELFPSGPGMSLTRKEAD